MSIRLAIVGSRDFNDFELFQRKIKQYLEEWGNPEIGEVISGGAAGADTLGEKWAKMNHYPITIYYPRWGEYGRAAGPMRNTQIVARCTHLVAFPSKNGHGTQDSISKAKEAKKEVKVCWFESEVVMKIE